MRLRTAQHRFTAVQCPTCGITAAECWVNGAQWQVLRCRRCGLGITWPRPEPQLLEALYDTGEYYESRGMIAAATGPALDHARQILSSLPRPPVRVLDVGAGTGHLVAAFRSLGFDAHGLEPSATARAVARRLHGLSLQPSLSPAGRYDLVTLIHSLEHLPEPGETLRMLNGSLAEGGSVFIEVPHAGSVEMWWPGRRRMILDLPAHLHHFTPLSLAALLHQTGFVVRECRLTNPTTVEWLLSLRRPAPARADIPPLPAVTVNRNALVHPPSTGVGPALRGLWREGLLPWIRRKAPGWKFAVVAEAGATVSRQPGARDSP